ncbi:hypothetical protein [Limibacterium fermenti]|uniref:hypothetical protein n=1 Tax=Limibacterium fermenti TaxID=3229863 RepID=UPI000E9A18D6|nr:hypothetical protein [Porphyromonadaceae bacterium]
MKKDHIRKLQLGRRAAYLKRCIRVLELLEQHETDCSVRKRVFYKHIRPEVGGSYTSFNNMLNEPNPRNQLDKIEKELNEL